MGASFYYLKMPVNLIQYRGAMGTFNTRMSIFQRSRKRFSFLNYVNINSFQSYSLSTFISFVFLFLGLKYNGHKISMKFFVWFLFLMGVSLKSSLWLQILLILLSGDVEINPGPKRTPKANLSICHWNLNSISAHNYVKLSLLRAYLAFHNFDIICLSETYLNSSNLPDDETLEIPGYNLVRSDHPLNSKHGGVCIYYKNYLPLRIITVNYLYECINFEIMIGNKIYNFITLYRSPSQNQDNFQAFIDNLEMNLETLAQINPYLMVFLGDFNAKSKHWCSQDSTNFEGIAIENVTSQFGLSQIITEATHILESSSSCIDLIFTMQPNLVVESSVYPSLHPNCHHQVVFAKFNLQIYYPPPYPREFWHYKQANTELIRRAITDFNWDRAFLNTNVNEKVSIFSSTILNILSNFIPHETINCDDKDPPIKFLIQEKKDTFNKYRKSKNNIQLLQQLRILQKKLNSFIGVSKQNYYSRMSANLTKFHTFKHTKVRKHTGPC